MEAAYYALLLVWNKYLLYYLGFSLVRLPIHRLLPLRYHNRLYKTVLCETHIFHHTLHICYGHNYRKVLSFRLIEAAEYRFRKSCWLIDGCSLKIKEVKKEVYFCCCKE